MTWDHARRVIVKAEHTEQCCNPRYVLTNLTGDPQRLYDQIYCARGEMENRIKEQQLDLFADRTSCSKWWPNQFRLLLSSLAYLLLEALRRLGLKGTELARAQCGTIRLKLLKIGAVIRRNTRRVYFHFSSAYPYQELFYCVARRLSSAFSRSSSIIGTPASPASSSSFRYARPVSAFCAASPAAAPHGRKPGPARRRLCETTPSHPRRPAVRAARPAPPDCSRSRRTGAGVSPGAPSRSR